MLTEEKLESFRLKGASDWVTIHVTYSSRADFIAGAQLSFTLLLWHNPRFFAHFWIVFKPEMRKPHWGAQCDPKLQGAADGSGHASCSHCVPQVTHVTFTFLFLLLPRHRNRTYLVHYLQSIAIEDPILCKIDFSSVFSSLSMSMFTCTAMSDIKMGRSHSQVRHCHLNGSLSPP